jgi:O-antigen chain-terminating methyltransferase
MTDTPDLDELMKRIRAEIAAKRAPSIDVSPAELKAASSGMREHAPPNPARRSFAARELLSPKRNADFLRLAYLGILGREPDAVGRGHYLKHLNHGRLARVVVLRRLLKSTEARARNVRVRGLKWRFVWHKATQHPPLRSIVNFGRGIRHLSRLPRIARDVSNFEESATQIAQQVAAEARVEQQALAGPMKASIDKLNRRIEPLADGQAGLLGRIETVAEGHAGLLRRIEEMTDGHTGLTLKVESIGEETRTALDRLGRAESDVAELRQQVADLTEALAAQHKPSSELQQIQQIQQIQTDTNDLRSRVNNHWRSIADQKLRLDVLLAEARKRLPEPFDAAQLQAIASERSHLLDAFYVSFEDRYRGTREDIKNRQAVYLPHARTAAETTGADLVDIGCGRGEWLELLRENGLTASGIDLNRIMIEECHSRGLNATLGDAIEILKTRPDRSLGAVTGFHIIEHIPFDVLVTLFDEVLRVLKPGGMVLFETPNPANLLVAAERFYMDPTHLNPLPSDLVSFIAMARGFSRVEVLELHPVDWQRRDYEDPMLDLLERKLFGPQDYSIIGWKES